MTSCLFILLTSLLVSAQAQTLSEIKSVPRTLGDQTLKLCLKNPGGCKNLPAEVIFSLHPIEPKDTLNSQSCVSCSLPVPSATPHSSPQETDAEKEETTVLLISELHNPVRPLPEKSKDYVRWKSRSTITLLPPPTQNGHEWPIAELISLSRQQSGNYEPHAQTLLINGIASLARNSPELTENELAELMASAMRTYSSNREIQLQLLNNLAVLLDDNYNPRRNPLQNTQHAPVPEGNISLRDLLLAAIDQNPDRGGVCNDISQSLAVVASKLFPKEDVLTINSGSHYAVLISDEKKLRTIINISRRSEGPGEITISNELPTTNTRFARVRDGRMEEITVADTELGQVFKKVSGAGTEIIQTGYTPSLLLAEFKKGTHKIVTGVAQTSGAQVLILVAQHKGKWLGFESQTQYGMGAEHLNQNQMPVNVLFSFQEVLKRQIFRYVAPGVSIRGVSGVQLDASYGFNLNRDAYGSYVPSFSANLQTTNALELKTTPKNPRAPTIRVKAEVDHFYGLNNIGAHQGAIAKPGLEGILNMPTYTGLLLNQINVQGGVQIPLQSTMMSQTDIRYQGTNIGQIAEIKSGLSVTAPHQVKIFAFVGYLNAEMKGYKTKHNLLRGPTGAEVGISLSTPNGTTLNTSLQGIGTPSDLEGNLKLSVPIKAKVRKKIKPQLEQD